eukprot:2509423-Prymnesium_polylepis.1
MAREFGDVCDAAGGVEGGAARARKLAEDAQVQAACGHEHAPVVVGVAHEDVAVGRRREVRRQRQLAEQRAARAAVDGLTAQHASAGQRLGDDVAPRPAHGRGTRAVRSRRAALRLRAERARVSGDDESASDGAGVRAVVDALRFSDDDIGRDRLADGGGGGGGGAAAVCPSSAHESFPKTPPRALMAMAYSYGRWPMLSPKA